MRFLEEYGVYTFSNEILKEKLSKKILDDIENSISKNKPLSDKSVYLILDVIKNWALENNARCFSHWFSPFEILETEKQVSFFDMKQNTPSKLSANQLIKGEVDASSFCSGGLRTTYSARGYLIWDNTANVFIKNNCLYLPALFYSKNGEALDDKIPLIRSMNVLNEISVKLLHLLGLKNIKKVIPFVGIEQEFFLVDNDLYNKRLDLKLNGRTLLGSNEIVKQKYKHHYLSIMNEKVNLFMKDLDEELWKFKMPIKLKHNEGALNQHEVVCFHYPSNIALDNNNLLMKILQETAKKHNLSCLLHEKPFKGLTGSGKHNNWSLIADNDLNLFEFKEENSLVFLSLVACLIKGVDEFDGLIIASVSSLGNDFRLGGNEAPSSIISISLGENLSNYINSIIEDKPLCEFNRTFKAEEIINLNVNIDRCDRNRTAFIAFTGNKFEIRGAGSSKSIALLNTMLNTILSYEMKEMIKLIEEGNKPLDIIKMFLKNHQRRIFEGDCYSNEWEKEAKRRKLSFYKDSLNAFKSFKQLDQIKPLIELGVYSNVELDSRFNVLLECYSRTIQNEALTILNMVKTQIYPISVSYVQDIITSLNNLKKYDVNYSHLQDELVILNSLTQKMYISMNELDNLIQTVEGYKGKIFIKAKKWKREVLEKMNELRLIVDQFEEKIDKKKWPIPTYSDLLFDNN